MLRAQGSGRKATASFGNVGSRSVDRTSCLGPDANFLLGTTGPWPHSKNQLLSMAIACCEGLGALNVFLMLLGLGMGSMQDGGRSSHPCTMLHPRLSLLVQEQACEHHVVVTFPSQPPHLAAEDPAHLSLYPTQQTHCCSPNLVPS